MAARTSVNDRRFVSRASDKESKAYYVPANKSRLNISSRQSQPPKTPVSMVSPRAGGPPARRVVVIRNTKNNQIHQGPVDLGDFGQPNSIETPPVVTNGHTSIYLIRRPINKSEPTKSVH